MTNLKLGQNSVNQISNPHAFIFFLLTGASRYYQAFYIVFAYFASFTGYEDDIFEVISNFQVQGSKFGKKLTNLAENLFKNLTPEFMEFVFSKSEGQMIASFINFCLSSVVCLLRP